MPWFKVDDGFSHHGKVLRLPRKDRAACIGMWCLAGSWSAKTLTDGRIDADLLPEFGGTRRLADQLVKVGLWSIDGDGYRFHDWDKYQPTKAAVEDEREQARIRMANARAAKKRSPEVQANTKSTPAEVQECSDNPAQPSPSPSPSRSSVETSAAASPNATGANGGGGDDPEWNRVISRLAAVGIKPGGWSDDDEAESRELCAKYGWVALVDEAMHGKPPNVLRGCLSRWRQMKPPKPTAVNECPEHGTHSTKVCIECHTEALIAKKESA